MMRNYKHWHPAEYSSAYLKVKENVLNEDYQDLYMILSLYNYRTHNTITLIGN